MIIETGFNFGDRVRDLVTGFEGTVTAFVKHMTGCDQYCLAPPYKDGPINRGEWFDADRLSLITCAPVNFPRPEVAKGGDSPMPAAR